MAQSSRTFRIFVSSTFSDLTAERNALQERVFPRLRNLCEAHGCRFQAVDLRWGVSEEAALDQQTMKICLGEIIRCQQVSPRPNFIILLGERYGWRPLPYEIPQDEYVHLSPHLAKEEALLVEQWYRLDENAVPPVMALKARVGEYVEFTAWETVERHLHQALENAARGAMLDEDALLKFTASATEQEIVVGALRAPQAQQHVFGYFRTIQGLPQDSSAQAYLDLEDGQQDLQASAHLAGLKQRLMNNLGVHCHTLYTRWQGNNPAPDHIDELCRLVQRDLWDIIEREISLMERELPILREVKVHKAFARQRASHFTGQSKTLAEISGFLEKPWGKILLVQGESGSGKSTLMAHSWKLAMEKYPQAVTMTRFVGITPESQDMHSLLSSLSEQLRYDINLEQLFNKKIEENWNQTLESIDYWERGWVGRPVSIEEHMKKIESARKDNDRLKAELLPLLELPEGLSSLANNFAAVLGKLAFERKVLIFIDAVDQLETSVDGSEQHWNWLPKRLPPNLGVVVSMTYSNGLSEFEQRYPDAIHCGLSAMTEKEGSVILQAWLQEEKRKLQPSQQDFILNHFAQNGLPLYLRLAFEQARHWHSTDLPTALPGDVPGIITAWLEQLIKPERHGCILVSHGLGYLSAARSGLSEDEMLDLLSADKDVMQDFWKRSPQSPHETRLPISVWLRLYGDLNAYMIEHSVDGALLMGFFHRQITAAVAAAFASGEQAFLRHAALGAYFGSQPLCLTGMGSERLNPRKLREQIFQLIQSGNGAELVATLLNFNYLLGRIKTHGVPAAQQDYDLALQSNCLMTWQKPVIQQVRNLLDSCERTLREDPYQLAPQLFGRSDKEHLGSFLEQAGAWKEKPWLKARWPSLGSLSANMQPGAYRYPVASIHPSIWGQELLISPDGNLIAAATAHETIRVWSADTGKLIKTLSGFGPERRRVSALALSPNGNILAAGSSGSMTGRGEVIIKTWSLEDGLEQNSLVGPSKIINDLRFLPDGRLLIVDEKAMLLFDLKSKEPQPVVGESNQLLDLSADGSTALTIKPGEKQTIIVRFLQQGKWRALSGHTGEVNRALMLHGEQTVVSAGQDGMVIMWDLKKQKHQVSLKVKSNIPVLEQLDRGWVIIGTERGELWIINLLQANNRLLCTVPAACDHLVVFPDTARLVAACSDNTLRLVELPSGEISSALRLDCTVRCIKVMPSGSSIIVMDIQGRIHVLDLIGYPNFHTTSQTAAKIPSELSPPTEHTGITPPTTMHKQAATQETEQSAPSRPKKIGGGLHIRETAAIIQLAAAVNNGRQPVRAATGRLEAKMDHYDLNVLFVLIERLIQTSRANLQKLRIKSGEQAYPDYEEGIQELEAFLERLLHLSGRRKD